MVLTYAGAVQYVALYGQPGIRANDIPEPGYQLVREEFLTDYQNLFTQISISSKILASAMMSSR